MFILVCLAIHGHELAEMMVEDQVPCVMTYGAPRSVSYGPTESQARKRSASSHRQTDTGLSTCPRLLDVRESEHKQNLVDQTAEALEALPFHTG